MSKSKNRGGQSAPPKTTTQGQPGGETPQQKADREAAEQQQLDQERAAEEKANRETAERKEAERQLEIKAEADRKEGEAKAKAAKEDAERQAAEKAKTEKAEAKRAGEFLAGFAGDLPHEAARGEYSFGIRDQWHGQSFALSDGWHSAGDDWLIRVAEGQPQEALRSDHPRAIAMAPPEA